MKKNRLINKKTSYLLQHAYNLVDWYPWSEEACRTIQRHSSVTKDKIV